MQCKKCNKQFSRIMFIDGKQRNLQNRKYCFDCSPFGKHNTRVLDANETNETIRKCNLCGKQMFKKSENGKSCWVCTNRKNRQSKIEKIKKIVGEACWFCGYLRCWQAIEFHHVHPNQKLFSLSTREMQFSWNRILNEVKKCVLTCACCHREIHSGLIPKDVVENKWKEKWDHQ